MPELTALERIGGLVQGRLHALYGMVFGYGPGTPEGQVSGAPGSTYSRTDGGPSTAFYTKASGTGNTGWRAQNPIYERKPGIALVAGSGQVAIDPEYGLFAIAGSGGAVTGLTVADGTYEGQEAILIGTNDTNTAQLADSATLHLGSATRTLGDGDILRLLWFNDIWYEAGFFNN